MRVNRSWRFWRGRNSALMRSLLRAAASLRLGRVRFAASTSGGLAILLLVAAVWMAFSNLEAARTSDALRSRLRQAQSATGTLVSTLRDAETGQRGFLLTGRPAYLESYESARAGLDGDFARLERVLPASPARTASVQRMRALAADKMAELGQTIALHDAGQPDAALELVESDRGKQTMDLLRAEAAALRADLASDLLRSQAHAVPAWDWVGPAFLGVLASALLGGVALEQRRARRAVAASMARLDRFTRAFALAQGLVRNLDGRITFWSEGTERLYGYTPKQALGRISHELLQTRFPGPLPQIEADLLRTGQWQGELVQRCRDGSRITVSSHWALHRGMAGEADAVIQVSTDRTAEKQAEEEREQASSLLRAVMDAAPGLIYAKDANGRMLVANPAVLGLIGKPWAEVAGRTDLEFLDDKGQAGMVMENDRRVLATGEVLEMEEVVGSDAPGRTRVWLSTKTPLRDPEGRIVGLVGVSVEITDRKQAEERRRLLIHELNHRVKNTLATVQAIASQTLRGSDPAIQGNLEARLMALASAHDVLTAEGWAGANLLDVVAGVLAPHGGLRDERFKVSGGSVRLAPGAALALAMGLHELATNAIKHGALSCASGRVEIRWEVMAGSPAQFILVWTERGGPPVAPPARRSFGTKLLERSLAQDLGGSTRIEFAPSGVVCMVEAPLFEIAAPAEVVAFPRVGVMQASGR